eukprot:4127209-Prorocentrum_lima.AAC.1
MVGASSSAVCVAAFRSGGGGGGGSGGSVCVVVSRCVVFMCGALVGATVAHLFGASVRDLALVVV